MRKGIIMGSLLSLFILVTPSITYASTLSTATTVSISKQVNIHLRAFPYPYRAMLSIDSDADHVDLRKFNIVHAFINSKAETPLGQGLGLDVSDSFFLYDDSNLPGPIDVVGSKTVANEMTLFKGISDQPSVYAPILLDYMRHGWIDTFHSSGDFSRLPGSKQHFSRQLVVKALAWLAKHHAPAIADLTDHGNQYNVGNFGSYHSQGFYAYQQGEVPTSPYYVADLYQHEGVHFLWPDRFDSKYRRSTEIYPIRLANGSMIWGFHRFTGYVRTWRTPKGYRMDHWRLVWTPDGLWEELLPSSLQRLISRGGYAIVANHLEGNEDYTPLNSSDVEALVHLAHLQDQGKILVARTSRLLFYNLIHQGLRYRVYKDAQNQKTVIDITKIIDPVDGDFVPTWKQLRGVTFDVPQSSSVQLVVDGQPVPATDVVLSANTIGIAWYPPDTTDWAVSLHSKAYEKLVKSMNKG